MDEFNLFFVSKPTDGDEKKSIKIATLNVQWHQDNVRVNIYCFGLFEFF